MSSLSVSFAHFLLVHQNAFYSVVCVCTFCTSYLFIIIIIWWVRWIWKRRIWQNWVWIRFSWYTQYRIGWVVAWLRNYFQCNAFFWWVMWWWRRVTCTPMEKHCWSVYRRMYWWCQYLLYCVKIVWIMDWSDVFQIIWNGLIRVGVIWIIMNWMKIF